MMRTEATAEAGSKKYLTGKRLTPDAVAVVKMDCHKVEWGIIQRQDEYQTLAEGSDVCGN